MSRPRDDPRVSKTIVKLSIRILRERLFSLGQSIRAGSRKFQWTPSLSPEGDSEPPSDASPELLNPEEQDSQDGEGIYENSSDSRESRDNAPESSHDHGKEDIARECDENFIDKKDSRNERRRQNESSARISSREAGDHGRRGILSVCQAQLARRGELKANEVLQITGAETSRGKRRRLTATPPPNPNLSPDCAALNIKLELKETLEDTEHILTTRLVPLHERTRSDSPILVSYAF